MNSLWKKVEGTDYKRLLRKIPEVYRRGSALLALVFSAVA
jgi:hypothetical protein